MLDMLDKSRHKYIFLIFQATEEHSRNKIGVMAIDRKASIAVSDASFNVSPGKHSLSFDVRDGRRRSNWKKLAFSFGSMGRFRRASNLTDSHTETRPAKLQMENTYKLRPDNDKIFSPVRVQHVVTKILEEQLYDVHYDPEVCSALCTEIADAIKERVKILNFPRYKLICNVMIGQAINPGLSVSSLSLLDSNADNFTSVSFKSKDICAVAIVHGIYME